MLVAFCLPTKVSCFLASLAFVFTNKFQTCEVCQQHLGLYFDLNSLEIPLGRKRRKFRELLLHSCLCRGKTSPEKGKKMKPSLVQSPRGRIVLCKNCWTFLMIHLLLIFFFFSSKWVFVSKFLSFKNATTSLTKSKVPRKKNETKN